MVGSGVSVPGSYEGREQAFIKHRLLESYLEKLFLIVGMRAGALGMTELCSVPATDSTPYGRAITISSHPYPELARSLRAVALE